MSRYTIINTIKVRGLAADRTDLKLTDIPIDQEVEYYETDNDKTYIGSRDGWVEKIDKVSAPAPNPISSTTYTTMVADLASDPTTYDEGTTYQITDNSLGTKGYVYVVSGGALVEDMRDSSGNTKVADQTIHAGDRSPASTTEGYKDVRTDVKAVVLTATSAVAIGSSSAANDMRIFGLIIEANATAVTATIAGMGNESGTAKSITFTGNASGTDARAVVIDFGSKGILNNVGALTVTASVADKVTVLYRSNGA